jgi:hypothetical protein
MCEKSVSLSMISFLFLFSCFYNPSIQDGFSGGAAADANGPATVGTTLDVNTMAASPTSGDSGSSTAIWSTGDDSATATVSQSTGSSGATTFDPADCSETVVSLSVPTPSVVLVLDKSGSMAADPGGFWDHDQDPNTPKITRWKSLYSVVDLLLKKFNATMNVGAVLFPAKTATSNYSEAACVVDAAADAPIAGMNAVEVLSALPGPLTDATMMKGGTPATKGLKVAISELASVPTDEPRFIVFVTDGAANCQENAVDTTALFEVYDGKVMTTVAGAKDMGVKTYVVGVSISQEVSGASKDGDPDGINSYEKLNEMAVFGGVARLGGEKFFNSFNQGELNLALETVFKEILVCNVELAPSPKFPEFVHVAPFGKEQVVNCNSEDGWKYLPKINPNDPDEPLRIELCGSACDEFQVTGKLDVQYRCPE